MAMEDCFAILGLPRSAALDQETLHKAYAEKSRAAHPDHDGNDEKAAEVNAAYATLKTPEKRLKHVLEVAAPDDAKAWRTVPMDEPMMELFLQLGKTLDLSAKFLEKKNKTQSALGKALLANEEMQQRETLESIGFEIEKQRVDLEARLPALDEAIQCADEAAWKQVALAQARFAYLGKWQTQVRERLLALM